MKTAIIGLGNIGKQLAANLVAGGQELIVADHTAAKAQAFAKESGGKARAASVAAAIEAADIIVFAVYFDAIKSLLAEFRNALAGKIVVDPSNPIAPDGSGGFKKTIPADQSSGQILAGLLPPGAKLVKAFGTLAAPSLKTGVRRSLIPTCCSMRATTRRGYRGGGTHYPEWLCTGSRGWNQRLDSNRGLR